MKSTKLAYLFAGALFLTSTTPSLAISPTPAGDTLRQQLRQDRLEAKTTIVEARQSFWTQARKKTVTSIHNRIRAKIQKRYDWLTTTAKDKIMDRIEVKEKAKNVDLSALKTKLNSISEYADDFSAKMAQLDQVYQELLTLDRPFTNIQKLNDARKAVVEVLNTIRRVEVEVLREFWKK